MTTTSTQNRSRLYNSLVCLLAIPFFAAACAGCGSGTSESESKMTSYTSSEQKADTAQTFQIRQDQLAHVQVVAVQRENLPRTLRLTGAVAYNAFQTSPTNCSIARRIFTRTAPSRKPICSRRNRLTRKLMPISNHPPMPSALSA